MGKALGYSDVCAIAETIGQRKTMRRKTGLTVTVSTPRVKKNELDTHNINCTCSQCNQNREPRDRRDEREYEKEIEEESACYPGEGNNDSITAPIIPPPDEM